LILKPIRAGVAWQDLACETAC